jgi:hypothetical protein
MRNAQGSINGKGSMRKPERQPRIEHADWALGITLGIDH